jgi:hypothetical protein
VARLYSTQFVSRSASTGVHSVTVPTGYVWVVRSISLYGSQSAGTAEATVFLGSGGTVFAADLAPTNFAFWNGRHVINAADTLEVFSSLDTDFLVSGYQLSTP